MPSLTADRPRLLTAISFVLGLATIAGAWGSQLIGGLVPCELCLEQRLAYYWGLPVLALILIFWNRLPRTAWHRRHGDRAADLRMVHLDGRLPRRRRVGLLARPHRLLRAPVSAVSFRDLTNINATRVVPCDAVQWRLLGLSLAGYNAPDFGRHRTDARHRDLAAAEG